MSQSGCFMSISLEDTEETAAFFVGHGDGPQNAPSGGYPGRTPGGGEDKEYAQYQEGFKKYFSAVEIFLRVSDYLHGADRRFGAYAYMNTENILLEQSYSNMEENLARASNNMDMVLEGYENASSLIFMNKQVQDLISVDFTNYGYEDLYYYLKSYFGTMMAINSDVNTFSIYTTNQTIAQDYYFIYKVDEEIEQEGWYKRAREENGKPVFMREA